MNNKKQHSFKKKIKKKMSEIFGDTLNLES